MAEPCVYPLPGTIPGPLGSGRVRMTRDVAMTDEKPELTKTEVRQGNSRKMNSRVLIFGIVAIVVLFAAVYWFSTATYDETATTTDGGATLEDVPAADDDVEGDLDALPTPVPADEAVTEPETPATATPEATAPAETEDAAPASEETQTPAAQ